MTSENKMIIKRVLEGNPFNGTLTEYSGYCIIKLIACSIQTAAYPLDEDFEASFAFSEYDYDHTNKRPPNSFYISAVHRYLAKMGLEEHDV